MSSEKLLDVIEIMQDVKPTLFPLENPNQDFTIVEYFPTTHDDSIPYFRGQNLSQWYSNIEEAKQVIELYQISTHSKFIKLNNHKYGADMTRSRIRWDESTKVPYILLRSLNLECQHAKDRNKDSNETRRIQNSGPYRVTLNDKRRERKRYKCSKVSKKVDCKALINVLEVVKFPQYMVTDLSKRTRTCMSKLIRKALQAEELNLIQQFAVRVTFPALESHTGHSLGEVTDSQSTMLHISDILGDIQRVTPVVQSSEVLTEVKGELESILRKLTSSCEASGVENELSPFSLIRKRSQPNKIEWNSYIPQTKVDVVVTTEPPMT